MPQSLPNYFLSLIAAILGSFLLIFLAWQNWQMTSSEKESTSRLRLHVVADKQVTPGMLLKKEHVRLQLSKVSGEDSLLISTEKVVGKYAMVELKEGVPIKKDMISAFAPKDAPLNGAVVSVEIKTVHAGNLSPGMLLAFVHNKRMLPTSEQLKKTRDSLHFRLLAVTPSSQDPTLTTLTVQVLPNLMDSVAELATDTWRPVVLGLELPK